MLVDAETGCENWNFLMYGRIGRNIHGNLYIQCTTVQCDSCGGDTILVGIVAITLRTVAMI